MAAAPRERRLTRHSTSLAIGTAVCLSFAVYAVIVIWRQSFLCIDGQRYSNFADDGLITLRSGWNLAHGNGFVWNPGERVEAITNMGWALYAAGLALFLDRRMLPFAMQLTCVVTLIATAIACRRIYRTTASSHSATAQHVLETIALLVPLCYLPLINWTLWGMETGAVAALVAMALSLMIGTPSSLVGSLLLGLAFTTRPDVAAPAAVLLALRWFRRQSSGSTSWHRWAEIVPFIAVAISVTIFRWAYYGALVPNTYVLKVTGTPVLERIQGNGFLYVSSWINDSRVLVGLLVTSLIVRPKWDKLLLASVLASMLASCLYVGGDAFTQFRFLAPYVPLAFLVVLSDVPALSAWIAARVSDARIARRAAPACAVVAACLFLLQVWTQTFSVRQKPSPENIANINTAIYLNGVLGPRASVGVFFAGTVPYYTGLTAVDFLGKADPYIARLAPDMTGAISARGMRNIPGHDKYDLTYSILGKRPTYIADFRWGRQDLAQAVSASYVRVPVGFETWPESTGRSVLLLRDSPDVDWATVRSAKPADPTLY
jgi:arabinofuranosyltransferase